MKRITKTLCVGLILSGAFNTNAQTPGTTGTITGADGIIYTTVVALDNKVWTQQNLGAVQVASSDADAVAYGDLYQWGRWMDGHQTRTPDNVSNTGATPNDPRGYNSQPGNPFYASWWWNANTGSGWQWTANTPADIDSGNGCDPCKQIFGTEWQIPTAQQWVTVLGSESIVNSATAFSSNLKLTVAGTRSASDGDKKSAGSQGHYWSSTVCNNFNNGTQTAKEASIGVNSAGATGCMSVGTGMPVRCIKAGLPSTHINDGTGYKSILYIYPNPANDVVTVSNIPETATLVITDMTGKKLYQTTNSKTKETISTTRFANGIYMIHINHSGISVTQKLVVNK